MTRAVDRRILLQRALAVSALSLLTELGRSEAAPQTPQGTTMTLTTDWDKVFPKSDRVQHRKFLFRNRYGITLAADLYEPKTPSTAKLSALAVSGPFGAVKEQSSGLYAQKPAERGFITFAFDPSFTDESGGEIRNVAPPSLKTSAPPWTRSACIVLDAGHLDLHDQLDKIPFNDIERFFKNALK